MKKIITVIGARPQFIKAANFSRALQNHPDSQFSEVILHTGQHFDSNMSEVFFTELQIPNPHYNLDIHGGTHGEMTGKMLIEIEKVFIKENPDWVLVYGDTNSTLAGALAASKLHIPVAHVEAGLRSFNKKMPEEVNRILTDQMSTFLFTPTLTARHNLLSEGVPEANIINVGDIMYDAALFYGEQSEQRSFILKNLQLETKKYILATCHRAENTDTESRLKALFLGLSMVAETIPVVMPIHPRTLSKIQSADWFDEISKNLKVIQPVGYLDMISLEKNAALIATDSGGVQKEAFFYKVPCITLRDETEWTELVDSQWNTLCPPMDKEFVSQTILSSLNKQGQNVMPYGRGNAAELILKQLLR